MKLKTSTLIHLFALLHVLTSLFCGLLAVDDSLLLTVLTIALTLIICLRSKSNVELTVISIVLANVFGFLLGELFASAIGLALKDTIISHAISTAATTETLGWAIVWFTARYKSEATSLSERERKTQISWLAVAVVAVYLIRVFISLIFSSSLDSGGGLTALKDFLYNPLMLLLIMAASVIFILYTKREGKNLSYSGKILTHALYFIAMTLFSALFVGIGLPLELTLSLSAERFLLLLAVSLVANAAIFSFCYIGDLALTTHKQLEVEREKADKARYQYLLLKQQVNPHFLFNSLNVLDALVADGSKEDASRFIHQLARLYRYMLKGEDEDVVTLREEMDYSKMYSSLVKMRWQESLIFDINIREEDLGYYVVPCSVQLCIENAIKHNSMSVDKPLRISVSSDGAFVTVSNPLVPKVGYKAGGGTGSGGAGGGAGSSGGLGLKYIKKQYLSQGSTIVVESEGNRNFVVKLPLL